MVFSWFCFGVMSKGRVVFDGKQMSTGFDFIHKHPFISGSWFCRPPVRCFLFHLNCQFINKLFLVMIDLSSEKNIKLFSYNELRAATDSFYLGNKIGHGGFGTVYKGILRNGTPIAVKVLSLQSKQGVNEFLTEIDVITNIKHPNLVQLIGCCVQDSNRILVYEYVENSSLDRALLGSNSAKNNLNWEIRVAICVGVAKGLAYLHEGAGQQIVHRDIKASNILLDKRFLPKIGDFGLAKLFPDDVSHIITRVAGTNGYLAPEYAMQGQLTKKADIYSFGVLVLEIVCAKSSSKPYWSGTNKLLLEKAWELYEEGRLPELVDPSLGDYPQEEVLRYMKVALFCTQAKATRRPSMSQALHMLSKPTKLNEKELTPPGVIQELKSVSSASPNSIPRFSSSPLTSTEMFPR
ncbi:putative LRR receptor-like serine/threonine-protein kinase [Platanthera zijinensis]|uniref:LRR receptor-like serine/threonine-protein kinase n=1 Tax=Platanthera zijinensis TaxID=2320716 RepID=A0AAP0BYB4_9ASPA